ncbi:MAG: hypothetical protein ACYC6F_16400 [Longimicrobiales bacterium]
MRKILAEKAGYGPGVLGRVLWRYRESPLPRPAAQVVITRTGGRSRR